MNLTPRPPFHYSHRVTYADCTIGDHIYYSRYLEIVEAARGEFFRAMGASLAQLQAEDTIFPVLECHLKYRTAARYDDVLDVQVWISRLQGVRIHFGFRILNQDGAELVSGETYHACTSASNKPKRLPAKLLELWSSYLPEPAGRHAAAGTPR